MGVSKVVISGPGLWTPENSISNDELVAAYNQYAENYNREYAADITQGSKQEKPFSSAEFIEKASGIKNRHAIVKDGALDVERMCVKLAVREDSELSYQAEMAVNAARDALKNANKSAQDIDVVIVACSYTERAYPAIAIEVQNELGIQGFGFDMLVACSSATFALQRAKEMIESGTAGCVLCINPELTFPQVNLKDRDSHFIFGDVATAAVLEAAGTVDSEHSYQVLSTKAVTSFSNNIRSNFGYLARAQDEDPFSEDRLFHQEGRKVFKEVCPMAAEHISSLIVSAGYAVSDIKRFWLHQANINMNQLIAKKVLGRDPEGHEAPIVLDRYGNTASAGSMISFNLHHEDLQAGDLGVICSFGAGYSIGSLLLKKN